jgi:uncharacterized membrane protein YgcG
MRHGRFITAAAAAVAALAIGPGAALATPGSFTDDAAGDFAAGTIPANAWTVEPGSVALKGGSVADNFDGTTLGQPPVAPDNHPWTVTQWDGATGTATVGGGSVTVNGVHVNDNVAHGDYATGKVMEFRATFAAAPSQNIGLGDTFNEAPWAMFSTGNGTDLPTGLYARTRAVDGAQPVTNTAIAVNPTVPHQYRIEWSATQVKFYVDGALVATHTVTLEPMRPVISDFTTDATNSVKVDWLNMSEIAAPPSGTFTSRVFDAGTASNLTWGTLTAGAFDGIPAIQTRTGNTPVPDASWSAFTPVVNGAIQSPPGRRYIQYSAALTGTAPALDSVQINYDIGSGSTGTGGGSGTGSGSSSGGQSGGSGGSQGGGNSSTDKTKPKVTLIAATLRATKKGAVSFTYACPSTEKSCTITLKLKSAKKTVASKTFTVKGGKSKAVTLVLSKDARKLLAKRGSLKVSAVVKATDAAGNARTTTKAMTIRRATH